MNTKIETFRAGNAVHVRVTLPDGRQGEARGASELRVKLRALAAAEAKPEPKS